MNRHEKLSSKYFVKVPHDGNPYEALSEAVKHIMRDDDGYEEYTDVIAHIWTDVLEHDYVVLTPDMKNSCYWSDYDWYEGGEIYLLGLIRVDDVVIPDFTEKNGRIVWGKEAQDEN